MVLLSTGGPPDAPSDAPVMEVHVQQLLIKFLSQRKNLDKEWKSFRLPEEWAEIV